MANLWGGVSAMAGILAIGIMIYVFVQGREDRSKKLGVELVARSTLVNTDLSDQGEKIEIFYDGKKIPDFSILQLRIFNSGGQPIRTTDYEGPIRLEFSDVATILSVETIISDPPQLLSEATISSNTIEIPAILLNPGDWFVIEAGIVAVSERVPSVKVTGRIAGVKRIEFRDKVAAPKEEKSPQSDIYRRLALLVSTLAASMSGIIVFRELKLIRQRH